MNIEQPNRQTPRVALTPLRSSWETSRWRPRFGRSGRSPAPRRGTAQASFSSPRPGRYPGEPVRNLTLRRPSRASGPPRARDPPAPPAAEHDCAHIRRAKWHKSRPPPGFAGGSCVTARWAAQIVSTPRFAGGERLFVRGRAAATFVSAHAYPPANPVARSRPCALPWMTLPIRGWRTTNRVTSSVRIVTGAPPNEPHEPGHAPAPPNERETASPPEP